MREVDPKRFRRKQPEEVHFDGQNLPEREGDVQRTNEPTDQHSGVGEQKSKDQPGNSYAILVPGDRRKIRHTFDIFEDQLAALKKLQIAVLDEPGSKQAPTLGDMVREAIDSYIQRKINQSPNLELVRQRKE